MNFIICLVSFTSDMLLMFYLTKKKEIGLVQNKTWYSPSITQWMSWHTCHSLPRKCEIALRLDKWPCNLCQHWLRFVYQPAFWPLDIKHILMFIRIKCALSALHELRFNLMSWILMLVIAICQQENKGEIVNNWRHLETTSIIRKKMTNITSKCVPCLLFSYVNEGKGCFSTCF